MIESIREPLTSIYGSVDGAVAAVVMGFDGVEVDQLTAEEIDGEGPDVGALLIEYSTVLGQVQRSAQMFAAGGLEEVAITSEHLTTIIRPLNEDYFVALALRPRSNFGRGRYLLRLHAPRLRSALA